MASSNSPVNLSSHVDWRRVSIGGYEFDVEIFETLDLLGLIDQQHREDPHQCMSCLAEFVVPFSDELFGRSSEYFCPHCGAKAKDKKIRFSQLYLDSVAKLLRDRFGVPRVGRVEAHAFYTHMVAAGEDLKKKAGVTVKSDSTSASIPPAGKRTKSGRGSKT